jgi:tRNA (cytidine/uridine-2'-O-)-methyltransferase
VKTDRDNLQIVLVEPEIHGNTGNIGRTCLAVGAQLHLVQPLGFSLDDARVRRAGLDYWQRVRPRVWSEWESFEAEMSTMGEPYVFTAEAEREYWDVPFSERAVLLFGRESVGLPRAIRDRYRDRCVRFPIHDSGVRSLNLANSVALAAYEVLRQRREI